MKESTSEKLPGWLSDMARSDHLPMLSGMLAPLFRQLGQLGIAVRFRVVLDSSTVIGELRWMAVGRRDPNARSALAEAIAARVVVACVPKQIDTEVRDNLLELEEQTGVPQQAIWGLWLEYRQLLTFVEADAVETAATAYLRNRDLSDITFVRTAESVGAEALLTADRDLLDADPRATPAHEIVIDLRNYAREKSIELTVYAFGTISFQVSGHALVAAIRVLPRLGGYLTRLPWWLKLAAVGGVIWFLASSERRERAAKFLRDLRSMIGSVLDGFMEQVEALMRAAAQSHERAELARARIAERVRPRKLLLRQAVRIACAEAGRPLSIVEIDQTVRELGYATKAKNLGPWILRTLNADSRFVHVEGSWSIKLAVEEERVGGGAMPSAAVPRRAI